MKPHFLAVDAKGNIYIAGDNWFRREDLGPLAAHFN
jgi:hypothetical protein